MTKNLSELRSFILGEMVKALEHAMTKTKLEKIIYSFHYSRSMSGGSGIRSWESLTEIIRCFRRAIGDEGIFDQHNQWPYKGVEKSSCIY